MTPSSAWYSEPVTGWGTNSRESRLGAPVAVVEVARTVLDPAFRFAVTVTVCQVSHAPVAGKAGVATVVPLTAMAVGRAAVVPLAYRKVSNAGPAAAAVTVNCR